MTNEEKFHQDVLESLEHCVNELLSKSKEDFDSIEDYGGWIEECVIKITKEFNNSRYEYYENILEDKLDKHVSNLRRSENE